MYVDILIDKLHYNPFYQIMDLKIFIVIIVDETVSKSVFRMRLTRLHFHDLKVKF